VRRRVAVGVSIPVVVIFIGLLGALLIPSHLFVLTGAADSLGLLGPHHRFEGLVHEAPASLPSPPLWIVNGRLWDAAGGLRENPGLGVEGGRIVAARPEGASVLDATGLTVMPGLVDMHVHAMGGAFDGELMIAHGVTTARDVGSDLSGVLARRADDAAGRRLGPRLRVTGPYLVVDEEVSDQQTRVATPAEAAAAVQRLADAGVDGIKVHGGIDAAMLEAVVAAAHARGLWVAAHLDRVRAADAARLRVDTIEHGSGIDWDGGSVQDDVARDALARELAASGVAITPTLVVAEHAFTLPRLVAGDDPSLALFPWVVRRCWITSQIANAKAARLSAAEERLRRARLARLERFVARFAAAGGRVLAGSDAPAFLVPHGEGLQRELELLAEAGLGWEGALTAATRDAAEAIDMSGEIGLLQPGHRADLMLVSGDPGRDGIAVVRRVVYVVMDGRVLRGRRV
jgi:imidazolonepropionase-like amidohydrolase